MGRYPVNPRTGLRQPPAFEGVGTALFEIVAVIVIGFIVVTMIAALLYECVALWSLMLT